jgi:phage shock protein A
MLQAQANLAQNQTAFLARISETDAEMAQIRRRMDETDRRIEERFARIEALLTEHSRILADLPEAVHRRFDFHPPRPPTE